jgi:hypothetical protein
VTVIPEQLMAPSMPKALNEMDRRISAIEFGDPHDLRTQLENYRQWLGQAVNDLYSNDTGVYNWMHTYTDNISNWCYYTITNYILAHVGWAIAGHNYQYHAGAAPGTQPSAPQPPAVPAWWTVTYPDIPNPSRAGPGLADAVQAAAAAVIDAHEADHPPPEEPTP